MLINKSHSSVRPGDIAVINLHFGTLSFMRPKIENIDSGNKDYDNFYFDVFVVDHNYCFETVNIETINAYGNPRMTAANEILAIILSVLNLKARKISWKDAPLHQERYELYVD